MTNLNANIIDKNKIKVGDAFELKSASDIFKIGGGGRQIALVREVTLEGNVYCVKFSKWTGDIVSLKYELQLDDIAKDHYTGLPVQVSFMTWFWNICSHSQQDNIVACLENLCFKY
mgnify:CR=1 FL=1